MKTGPIVIDYWSPIRRQEEKVAKLGTRLFQLRRELAEAEKELARLRVVASEADAARKASR